MRLLSALLFGLGLAFAGRYRTPDPTRPLVFPRDQGSHDEARLEWWYVTGHLEEAGGKRFGFELTFFRSGVVDAPRAEGASPFAARDLVLAHLAFTDETAGTFRYEERIHRPMAGAAHAAEERLDVAIEDWRLEEVGGMLVLRAGDELSLLLTPRKPLVLHGENGLSRKGAAKDAVSRYVSFTRLSASGWLARDGTKRQVEGLAWFDHEWGSGALDEDAAGWDWFALQLEDGRDVMLYRMRSKSGGASPFASGTIVEKDGRTRTLSPRDFTVEETARWKSPRSGALYPSRWTLRVPAAALAVEVVPLVADQELVTSRSTKVTYWEGACGVRALEGGRNLGKAYVELTGYAGAGALGSFR